MRLAVCLLFAALTGCAAFGTKHRDLLAPADASFVGNQVAAYAAAVLPPASSTVAVSSALALDASGVSALDDAALSALRSRGFAVAEPGTESTSAHAMTYRAYPLDEGVLLRVSIDGAEASRWYSRDPAGSLSPASSFTVRAAR